MALLTFRPKS